MKKILAAALLAAFSLAHAEDINPLDPRVILQELADLQAKSETAAATRQKQKIDLVFKASSSKEAALEFYEDAQMATQFQGANRENTQFRDWKKKQEDQLKDSAFRESIRLHLFYLGLTLKQAAGAKPEEMVPKVMDYLTILAGAEEALAVKESLLKQPVNGAIFSKWLELAPELNQVKEWEMVPGNHDQIAEKFLLPQWRKQKNPSLLTYWDGRIAREGAAAASANLAFQQNSFASLRKPGLFWQRAQELIVLDQTNRASQDMFAVIKANPNHPEVGNWIAALRKQLTPEKPVAVP